MYEKILIPLDGSETAEMVLPYAQEMAVKLGSEILLVSVMNPIHTDEDHLRRSYLEQVAARMQDQCKEYNLQKECKITTQILPGKPAEEILRYAESTNTGIIAMTNRGSSHSGPWSLGSIAAKILRAINKPVLLVRGPVSEEARYRKALVKRILVPLDGSKIGESALPYVSYLAEAVKAEVILFQVVEPIRVIANYENLSPQALPLTEESLKASANSYLNEVGRFFKEQQVKTSSVTAMGNGCRANYRLRGSQSNRPDSHINSRFIRDRALGIRQHHGKGPSCGEHRCFGGQACQVVTGVST